MGHIRKLICWLLVLCVLAGMGPVTVWANTEDPQALKNLEEFGAPLPEAAEELAEEIPEETPAEEFVPEGILETEEIPEEIPETEEIPEENPRETEDPAPLPEDMIPEEEEILPEETEEQAAEEVMPVYFQTDYPNHMYGAGTIASSGCSVTCLAMVASYMTGYDYRPEELARYFGGRAENNIARLEKGSDTLGLAWERSENWHKTLQALREGKIVIALMGETSLFTQSQHFILLKGLTEDGRILVHDPNGANYELWNLKKGFAEGFEEDAVLLGYSGGWIYDKAAMPEDTAFYYEPLPERKEPRFGIELTQAEIDLLARVVWAESRGESPQGQQAVAEVVLNRMASEHFPNTLENVIYGEGQFRTVPFLKDAQPYQAQYEAIENALFGPWVLPENVMYFATFQTNDRVWGSIGGHIFCYE